MASSAEVDMPMRRKRAERDWVALLGPGLIAVLLTALMNFGGYLWFMGTMQQRLATVELQLKVVEDTDANLGKVYVTRDDQAKQDALLAEQREDEKRRLDRIEGKVDLLLEGHR